MSSTHLNTQYPEPTRDTDNSPYLDGWKKGTLTIQKCQSCTQYVFFPRPMCPHCWSTALTWEQVSGKAEVVSYSLVRRPNHPSFNDEVPIVLAELMLKEGVSVLGRILADEAYTGMQVMLANSPENIKKYPLPVFQPM